MIELPKMVVEKRVSNTAHGLKRPSMPGSVEFEKQLQDTLEFVEAAKKPAGYPIDLLVKYDPFTDYVAYQPVMRQFGFNSWKECTAFVKDDECNEFFVRVAKWAKKLGAPVKQSAKLEGFIDGGGLGIHSHYLEVCKEILEKGFDAKWYYWRTLKTKRPLEHLKERLGFICPALFNYVHPGHPRYPAGHACKFFAAVVAANDIWELSEEDQKILLTAAYVLSMARSGGGVHLPEDNLAGGYLAGIEELSHYGK